MNLDKRAIIRILGAIIGGGVTAAIAIKKVPHATAVQKVMGGMATVGGATVGYYVAGWVADRIIKDEVLKLPAEQTKTLPGNEAPVQTPSADNAMGAVAERAAMTQPVSAAEVAKGPVVDIPAGENNVVPIRQSGTMDASAFGSEPK